jgi:predicted acetyltransferase
MQKRAKIKNWTVHLSARPVKPTLEIKIIMDKLTFYKTTTALISLQKEFYAFALETESDGVHLGKIELFKTDLESYIKIEENQSRGIGLPEGWVSHTRFWYILNEKRILGSLDLRHSLTPNLKDLGGHVGYVVRPSERNKGYATAMLAKTVLQADNHNLTKLLLTAASDNIASRKVIENNGGILDTERYSKLAGCMTAYYWIKIA